LYSQFIEGFITIGNPSEVTLSGTPAAHAVSHRAKVFDRVAISLSHEKEGGAPPSFLERVLLGVGTNQVYAFWKWTVRYFWRLR
jgi:hypothetical protein